MKATYEIEIGNKILINKIGVILGITGLIFTILFGLSIISSFLMPNEMTVIYLVEFIERKIYVILPISLLMFIIGLKIAKIRNFKPTKLTLELDKISFSKKGELIEIPESRLHKIIESNFFYQK